MSKLGKEWTYWELIKLLSWIIRQKAIVVSYLMKLKPKNGRGSRGDAERNFGRFSLEREKLLSKISRNPTVGSLRDKKGSCSTQRGLRVGTGFREFPQNLRGRSFSLLGFYSFFKYFVDV